MRETRENHFPFSTLACGRFPPVRVRVTYDPTPRRTTPAVEQFIADEWERQVALAEGTNRSLFNGPMLRYVSHTTVNRPGDSVLEMTVGPTCYRDFVGTNLYGQRLFDLGAECFANPVGTTATLISCDGLICYGRRSQRVAFHAGHVHTFGGALEPGDCAADGTVDVFASLLRELHEELELRSEDLAELQCVGLIRDGQIHQPELLFEAQLKLTFAELGERWKRASARDEHDGLVTLQDRPEAVVPFIKSCGPIAPVAVGALFIHGRLCWGDEWAHAAAEQLGN